MTLLNCAKCPSLTIQYAIGAPIAGCDKTGLVVPHHMDNTGSEATLRFHRIPRTCPRDDSEVYKSKEMADQSTWTILLDSEIPDNQKKKERY